MVRVQQCTIQTSAPSSGVAADAANLQLEKVTIKSSNGPGVSSSFGSTLGLTSCKVSGCAMPAVMVTQNSTLSMEKCTVTGNNTSLSGALGAISVFGSSSAFLRGNTISANKGQGITVQSGSTLQLMGGNKVIGNGTATTLQPNFRAGIGIAFSSHADLNPWPQGTAADQISENGGAGILLMSKADLMIMGAIINGNQGDGVELHGDSTANFTSGAVITNNQGWGIGCYDKDNDSKIMGAPGTISGNTLGASKCLQY
jgi:parallel beta-helix repeat protein